MTCCSSPYHALCRCTTLLDRFFVLSLQLFNRGFVLVNRGFVLFFFGEVLLHVGEQLLRGVFVLLRGGFVLLHEGHQLGQEGFDLLAQEGILRIDALEAFQLVLEIANDLGRNTSDLKWLY